MFLFQYLPVAFIYILIYVLTYILIYVLIPPFCIRVKKQTLF